MVRRRATKVAAFAAGTHDTSKNLQENSLEVTPSSCSHKHSQLEDQYFASPKRKDCKIEEGVPDTLVTEEQQAASAVFTIATDHKANLKPKFSATSKTRGERANIAGRTIGVPLATRSQTRTIENFFKAKTAAKNVKMQQDNMGVQQTMHNGEEAAGAGDVTAAANSYSTSQEELPLNDNVQSPIPEVIFNISEDTNDTDNIGEDVDEASLSGDFSTHRSPMRDSHSSRSSTSTNGSNTDNIFLQEPVLTLNVDKTPNQASSIKINTSLEVEPIFSLPHPHALTAAVLNGCFNQIVSLNGSSLVCKRDSFSFESQNIAIVEPNDADELLVPDNDNSSCDSGVAFTTLLNSDLLLVQPESKPTGGGSTGSARRRKPATPHRIVCPSPIKAVPCVVSSTHAAHGGGNSPSPYKSRERELLSPRKSPRQMAITNSKTRRRLNHQKEFSPLNTDKERTKLLSGCKKLDNVAIEVEQEDLNLENLGVSDLYKAIECKTEVAVVEKMRDHNKSKTHHTKVQQKSKYQPSGLPLATTNGNRELTEFFPVRRSVRKTKTAVKEEMMRNLEQAIIEERADGLKIAYFEGKGRGITADRHFERGEFVVEYVGDLISMTEATEREKRYALDENAGCYMYYFKHKNQQYCIDATVDTGKLGRLVNHSRNGNLVTKVVVVKQRPHLILIAKDNIEPGEELTYDYGDRSKEALLHHPWLAF